MRHIARPSFAMLLATLIWGQTALIACATLPAFGASGKVVAHNTPAYVSTAKNLGAVDPSHTIEVSIWLNPHNRAELDALAGQLYDRNSANYRHWLTRKEIAARFAATAAEAKTIQRFFAAHNLQVVKVGSDNFFVRARGTVADVQRAFNVRLNNYKVNGKVIRANDRDPYVAGRAGELVMTVAGLDSGKYEHPAMSQAALTGKHPAAAAQARVAPGATIFSSNCFPGTEKESFSTNNNGSLPIGTYSGNHLNLATLTTPGCAYEPPSIQAAYNLSALYAEGYDGTGQTIGIIDWCGSFTIQNDANVFSAQYGLPALTAANFTITNTAPSFCEAFDQVEINIDVEWAHAIAPGANINLIVPPSASFQDVDQAEFEAVNLGLANVLSGSYGSIESFTPATILAQENLINELAAVSGISANFSSGDNGDFTNFFIAPTVSAPASSPWATAVGGVTLALNPDNSIAWQAGWGTNQSLLAETGSVFDPPIAVGFVGGSGGGPSGFFAKPAYQKKLPGPARQLPDVGWLADPYTGAAILISIPGNVPEQVWQVWGGTSVACPMFAALWAIANQEALAGGGAPLGLAAPYLYSMPAGTIYDVVPVSSKNNVTASIQEATITNNYDANQVMGGQGPTKFVSAIWDYAFLQYTALAISFGTDCDASGFFTPCTSPTALHTKKGWDNVTGVGTPNGKAFADSFFGK